MPAPTGNSAARTSSCSTLQANPLGLDRSDPAAKDDVTTLNQLYLPVNKPIIVRLRSKDVIHSFGVPEFRVKQDAIPGLTIPIWFVPTVTTAEMRTRTGNPEFQYRDCLRAALRSGPFRMRGFVTVQTAEEFQKWMEEKVKEQSAPDPFGKPCSFRLQRSRSPDSRAYRRCSAYRTSSASASARGSAPAPPTVTRSRPFLRHDSSTAFTTIPRTNAGIFFMRAAAASSHAIVVGDSAPYWIARSSPSASERRGGRRPAREA